MSAIDSKNLFHNTINDRTVAGQTTTVSGTDISTTKRAADVHVVAPGFLDLIEPSLAASGSFISGEFVQKFEIPSILTHAGGSGIIKQISIVNKNAVTGIDLYLEFYGDNPTIASAAAAALSITDANRELRCIGTTVRSGSTRAATDNNTTEAINLELLVKNYESTVGTSIWCVVSSLSTFTSIQDQFQYRFGVIPL